MAFYSAETKTGNTVLNFSDSYCSMYIFNATKTSLEGRPQMQHTYLLEEGTWKASGCYWDNVGDVLDAEGEVTITHEDDLWINIGKITLKSEPPEKFENFYEIIPPAEGKRLTEWTSVNPDLGTFSGVMTFLNDAIFSLSNSEDGQYAGFDLLLMIDENNYINRGALFIGDEMQSSWSMELTRK